MSARARQGRPATLASVGVTLFLSYLLAACLAFEYKITPASSRGPDAIFNAAFLMALENSQMYKNNVINPAVVQSISSDPAFQLSFLSQLNRLETRTNRFNLDDKQHQIFLCYDNDSESLIGYCDLDRRPLSDNWAEMRAPRPHISDVIVHPLYRRKGIGRELLSHAISHARTEWCDSRPLSIAVELNNVPATTLYLSLGFRPVLGECGPLEDPRLTSFVQLRDAVNVSSVCVDRVLMQLSLSK